VLFNDTIALVEFCVLAVDTFGVEIAIFPEFFTEIKTSELIDFQIKTKN
jgi:hypothetical protein